MKAAYSVKYVKLSEKLLDVPPKDIVSKLIKEAKQPYKSIIAILSECELRRCEVLNLKYGDIIERKYGFKTRVNFSKSQPRAVYLVRYQSILHKWLLRHRSKDPSD